MYLSTAKNTPPKQYLQTPVTKIKTGKMLDLMQTAKSNVFAASRDQKFDEDCFSPRLNEYSQCNFPE